MIHPWQQTQWQHIQQLIESDRLPHGMLLLGNHGLGKADFSFAMANAVLCKQPTADHQACGHCKACQLLAADTHPDLYHLTPKAPPNSKSANPVLSIRVDDIRVLCDKLNQTSQYGGYRVAIIDQAEYLTISAANSLALFVPSLLRWSHGRCVLLAIKIHWSSKTTVSASPIEPHWPTG